MTAHLKNADTGYYGAPVLIRFEATNASIEATTTRREWLEMMDRLVTELEIAETISITLTFTQKLDV